MADNNFEYYVANKGGLVIITLVGKFRDCTSVVEAMLNEVMGMECTGCIIYARDVTELPPASYRDMMHIQTMLRKKFEHLKICSFNPVIKSLLLNATIV